MLTTNNNYHTLFSKKTEERLIKVLEKLVDHITTAATTPVMVPEEYSKWMKEHSKPPIEDGDIKRCTLCRRVIDQNSKHMVLHSNPNLVFCYDEKECKQYNATRTTK